MKLAILPAGATEWSAITSSEHRGESGIAIMRTRQIGDIRLRLVQYSPSYVGDHWCHKGHLIFVVAGQLYVEHKDGTRWNLSPGASWHGSDDDGSPHRARSPGGATVFIVD